MLVIEDSSKYRKHVNQLKHITHLKQSKVWKAYLNHISHFIHVKSQGIC